MSVILEDDFIVVNQRRSPSMSVTENGLVFPKLESQVKGLINTVVNKALWIYFAFHFLGSDTCQCDTTCGPGGDFGYLSEPRYGINCLSALGIGLPRWSWRGHLLP